jgi:hypothetical protein
MQTELLGSGGRGHLGRLEGGRVDHAEQRPPEHLPTLAEASPHHGEEAVIVG